MSITKRRSLSEEDDSSGYSSTSLWMVTFADLMSLMLTFFVLLVALTSISDTHYQAVAASLRTALGGAGAPLSDSVRRLVQEQGEGVSVSDVVDERTGLIRYPYIAVGKDLPSSIVKRPVTPIVEAPVFFTGQTATLSPQAFPVLDAVVIRFKDLTFPLRVEGYADDMPATALPAARRDIAARRAVVVAEYLTRKGIPEDSLSVAACYDYTHTLRQREPGQAPRQLDVVVLDK